MLNGTVCLQIILSSPAQPWDGTYCSATTSVWLCCWHCLGRNQEQKWKQNPWPQNWLNPPSPSPFLAEPQGGKCHILLWYFHRCCNSALCDRGSEKGERIARAAVFVCCPGALFSPSPRVSARQLRCPRVSSLAAVLRPRAAHPL